MGCRRRTNWWVAEILVESITLFVVFLSFYLSLWWLLFQYLLRFSAIAANVPNSPWFTSIVCVCVCVRISIHNHMRIYFIGPLTFSFPRRFVGTMNCCALPHLIGLFGCLFRFRCFFPSYSIHYYGIGYRTFCLHHIAFPIAFICGTLLCNVKQYW